MSLTEPHDEFLELCAVSTSGQLTEEEQKRLQEHLATCESCRQTLQQYQSVVRVAIPAIAASKHPQGAESDSSWSEQSAEKAFFQHIEREQRFGSNQDTTGFDLSKHPHRLPPLSSESIWRDVWILYGAGILLFVALGFYTYRVGVYHGADSVRVPPLSPAC